jgi:malate permease and related proteins
MNPAVQKTLSLIILLLIGFLLRKKFQDPAKQNGLKTLILTVALPAIIFVALLKAEIRADLLALPFLALGFNFILFFLLRYSLPLFGLEKDSPSYRTYLLLFPSLAPGLSCFPFLIEYLGDDALAWGALADIGNKFFVLIFAYMLAMNWFIRNYPNSSNGTKDKIKSLLMSLINEPINMVMILALILLGLGIHMENLPSFLSSAIGNLSSLMTPLVLIYIGIAVIFNWKQIQKITGLLFLRSGITFILSGLIVLLVPSLTYPAILVMVAFPQSAISFWPFAHMSAFVGMEQKMEGNEKRTFNLELAVNILAVSLPFSTAIMLGIFSFGETFTSPTLLIAIGILMIVLSATKTILKWVTPIELKAELKKSLGSLF